ncbi:MAG: HAMP domain-containing sensor histidine kinase [Pseudomonadota bacterium]
MPRSARPLSLRATALAYIAAFLVAFGIAGTLLYIAALRGIDREIDLRLSAETADLLRDKPARAALVARIDQREQQRPIYALGYMLLDASGRRIAGAVQMQNPPAGYSNVEFSDKLMGVEGLDSGRSLSTKLPDGSALVVVADSDPINYTERLLLRILVIGFVVSGVIVATGMLSLATTIRTRMRAVRTTAEAILDGDMTRRLPVTGRGGELDEEARTLNHMLDRIAELLASLKHVSDDVAHDLRTPLMRLRHRLTGMVEYAGATPLLPDIERAITECDGILDLFAAILRLSEIESGARRANFAPVDLGPLVADLVSTFVPVAEEGGRSLELRKLDHAVLPGDRVLLAQMLINLIENAMEHTPPGSKIGVEVHDAGKRLTISVSDDGPGIPPDARASVLRRFTRLDSSRTSKGHGLGLTLVGAIARLHGGTLVLDDVTADSAKPGLRVSIIFSRHDTANIQPLQG